MDEDKNALTPCSQGCLAFLRPVAPLVQTSMLRVGALFESNAASLAALGWK